MDRLSLRLKSEVDQILKEGGFQAAVSIQGSVARDTWLHDEGDLDIFASFPAELDRGQWIERVFPALRRGLKHHPVTERYAEHPFLEFSSNGITVNVVPCYAVEKGKWKSATDRTPFHTEYMRQHLTDDLKGQARLLKKFMKGIGVYGAEIRVGGFSGMLVETLILNYGSFTRTLEETGKWKNQTSLEVESSGRGQTELSRKFDAPLVVVDPVDPNRNLAAAVREERLWEFVAVGRQFLARPALSYFYPSQATPKTRAQLLKQFKHGHDSIVVLFPHPHLVLDILWGQLFSLERSLVSLARRHEFRVLHSTVWSDENRSSAVLLAVENAILPFSQLHPGPPVSRREESEAFLTRHLDATETVSGPWISGDRWMVEKKRVYPNLAKLVIASTKDRKLGLGVPAQLEHGFREKLRVLENEESLSLYSKPGFVQALWRFTDGKPSWLKTSHA